MTENVVRFFASMASPGFPKSSLYILRKKSKLIVWPVRGGGGGLIVTIDYQFLDFLEPFQFSMIQMFVGFIVSPSPAIIFINCYFFFTVFFNDRKVKHEARAFSCQGDYCSRNVLGTDDAKKTFWHGLTFIYNPPQIFPLQK